MLNTASRKAAGKATCWCWWLSGGCGGCGGGDCEGDDGMVVEK